MPDRVFPVVSVIIPTYNRKASLMRTLNQLSRQSYPAERFEAIVVDDGSTDETPVVELAQTPFALRYVRQGNSGATTARNHGAQVSRGEALVFMDDDIAPLPNALECLVNELMRRPQTICLGKLLLPAELTDRSAYARMVQSNLRKEAAGTYVSYEQCLTGFLAIRESDFRCLGKFQDPTGGWPNWEDLDFGYRAKQHGYRIWRSDLAVAEHWDETLLDTEVVYRRWYQAGRAAPRLIEKHQELKSEIGLLRDKGAIEWGQDSPGLIGRKLRRMVVSTRPALWAWKRLARLLEQHAPESRVLRHVYHWLVSGHVFQGYREGLRALAERRPGMESA